MTEVVQTTPPLVEREAEQEAVAAALDSATDGRGRFLLFVAPAGIGKTRLIADARARAAASELVDLGARSSELERDFAFGAARQLFEPRLIAADPAEREALFAGPAVLAEPLLTGGWAAPAGRTGDAELPLLHALYWLVANLSRQGPLLLSVDDLQWADEGSLQFLLFLASRIDSLPAAVVAAARPDEPGASPTLARLLRDPCVQVLHPAPLSPAAVRRVLGSSLGEPGDDFAAVAHRVTGGNAFMVQELVREHAARGLPPDDEHAAALETAGSRSIAAALADRLAKLPAGAADLACAVAVLAGDAEVRHAAALAGTTPTEAAAAAGALIRAGILADERPLRFAHPIVQSAAYNEMPAPERAAAHAAAAQLVSREGNVDAAAAHLVHAEPAGDQRAVSLLERAAERAIASAAPGVAARFLRRALEEPPSIEQRPAILAALGRAELGLAEPGEAEAHLREALDLVGNGRSRGDVVLALARALAQGTSVDDAYALIERERRGLEGTDPQLALELEAELASFGWMNGLHAPPESRIDAYAELPGKTPVERKLLAAVAYLSALRGRPAAVCAPVARRAFGSGKLFGRDGIGIAHWSTAFGVLAAAEDEAAVEEVLAEALEDARRHVAPFEFLLLSGHASAWAWRLGNLSAAEANGRVAYEVALEHGFNRRFPVPGELVQALVERGRLDEAEQVLTAGGWAAEPLDGFGFQRFRLARASLRLARRQVELATAELEAGTEIQEQAGDGGFAPLPFRGMLALATYDAAPARALDLAQADVRSAQAWGVASGIGVALRTLGLIEGGDTGIGHLRQAVELLAGSRRRLERARALVDLGAALRRDGTRKEAREHLREGLDLAQRCSADALVQRAYDELRATGARPRKLMFTGAESLTAMERRIADLAAQGLKNAEIAQALFVTVKNVEMHLTRTYRKLDISSRAELPAALEGSTGA